MPCATMLVRPSSSAIFDAVAAGAPTLRLLLGGDAVDGIRAKLARIAADVDHTERVARDTAFPAEA